MNRTRWGLMVAALAAIALIGGLVAVPQTVRAQDSATPVAGEHNHPAHIHNGTCDAVGEVVFPLNNVASGEELSSPEAEMEHLGTPMAGVEGEEEYADAVATSTTTISATFDDIADHVINIHESEENIGNYITCGAITGTADSGELEVTLNEVNGSGWQGEAKLVDNGDGTIDVTINLEPVEAGGAASPEASPAG